MGAALGCELRECRGAQSVQELSSQCGLAVDTLRAIERGSIASPGFFAVAEVATALGVSLDSLMDAVRGRVRSLETEAVS
ncbi:helix-turn-helix domain-containing protein [Luteipulveratus mongoliensis]|uniref:helix-turn-helix domain-containing protein n=1 Tax=Luteipulveratus mongoliensis TaxID=571913 RepID=UPI0009FADA11